MRKTLILNGSPHGKRGNTEIFLRKFLEGAQEPCQVCYAAEKDPAQLVEAFDQYETLLFFLPLYVHAMPGIVMEIIEHMQPVQAQGRSIGFAVQSGFVEAAQSDYLAAYLPLLAKRLGYAYLGCAVRGGAAGVCMMPERANAALFETLRKLGAGYRATGGFDQEAVHALGTPYRLTRKESRRMERLHRMRVGDLMWHVMLLRNRAFRKRRARPYAEE
jgi:hypothetical protein